MENRRNADVIREMIDPKGAQVLDIGCGGGLLTRLMTRAGAGVTGLEPNRGQLDKARRAEPAGDEAYVEGRAEDLPFDADVFDVVVFFNSLHHIPPAAQTPAMVKAVRVLKSGGTIYISEPVASGPYHALSVPIDDETAVQAHALGIIHASYWMGLDPVVEYTYEFTMRHRSYEEFRTGMIAPDPAREALFAANEDHMRSLFDRLGVATDDGKFAFNQPMRVNLLRKA